MRIVRSVSQTVLYWGVLTLVRIVAWPLFRPRSVGRANVAAEGGLILAPNHRSYVDPFVVALALRRQVRPMAKAELFKGALGNVLQFAGLIPVKRGTVDRGALATAEAALRRGQIVLIFPEGTRGTGDAIESYLDGVAYLSSKTGVPVVSVGIAGAETSLSTTSKTIRPSKIHIQFGSPIAAPTSESGTVGRSQLGAHTQLLRQSLQSAYAAARSAITAGSAN